MTLAPEPLYKTPDSSYGFRKCCEAIREGVPIGESARLYTELEPFGGNAWFTGRCALPDHEDKTPSASTSTHRDAGGATGAVAAATWWTLSSTAATTASSGKR